MTLGFSTTCTSYAPVDRDDTVGLWQSPVASAAAGNQIGRSQQGMPYCANTSTL
jgi:hypothetical protein